MCHLFLVDKRLHRYKNTANVFELRIHFSQVVRLPPEYQHRCGGIDYQVSQCGKHIAARIGELVAD
jgi:hypothetical protein